MDTRKSNFNRNLAIILVILYLFSLGAFSLGNWEAGSNGMQWWMVLLNIPILSIPLVLLFGSIYILVISWREHAAGRPVSPRMATTIHWAPRLAACLIIFFVSLFSLDVFESGAGLLEMLGGFLIHNIPSIAMLILLLFAWKRPAVGFWAFLAAGIAFAAFFVRSPQDLPSLLLFVLPILLVAGLFYADWRWLGPVSHTPLNGTA